MLVGRLILELKLTHLITQIGLKRNKMMMMMAYQKIILAAEYTNNLIMRRRVSSCLDWIR